MYQLERLIGEEKINIALGNFFRQHRYPKRPPVSEELLIALYKVAPAETHARIDELFKAIIVYDNKIETATVQKLPDGMFQLSFTGTIKKFSEDGNGNRRQLPADGSIQIAVQNEDGTTTVR